MLGAECWVQDAGCWVQGTGCRDKVIGAEYRLLGTGCWVLGAGCRVLPPFLAIIRVCGCCVLSLLVFCLECWRKVGYGFCLPHCLSMHGNRPSISLDVAMPTVPPSWLHLGERCSQPSQPPSLLSLKSLLNLLLQRLSRSCTLSLLPHPKVQPPLPPLRFLSESLLLCLLL